MARFEGIVPALVTPLDENDRLNEDALRRVIRFNVDAGADGFWVAGGSGESVLLDDDENRRIAEIAVETCAGEAKTIMHVGAATTKRAAALAEHAAKVGAEAICCVPPFFYGRDDEEIVEHYRIVGEAAGIPLFVYNLPSATGVEITVSLMSKIQDAVPQLRGLKHSASSFGNVRSFANMGLDCLIGNCRLMLPALTSGATGCVDGPPNVLPELWVKIRDAWNKGDLDGASNAQDEALVAYDAITPPDMGFHAWLKASLSERLGIDCGAPRRPGRPLTAEERKDLAARIDRAGLRL